MKRITPAILIMTSLFAQTIEEKKAQCTQMVGEQTQLQLSQVNQKLAELRASLAEQMAAAEKLHASGAQEEEYQSLLSAVQSVKGEMVALQERWRQASTLQTKREEEGYALWDQEETSLASLVMEYGASEYLYIVPPEMSGMKVTMHSNLPIPRESWGDMLEIILAQNGVGVKQVNPYTRQLFIFKQDPSAVTAIASTPEDIRFIQDHRRIFYVFSPPIEQVKTAFQFFERFSDPKMTFVYNIGGKIALVSTKDEIEKLIQLYNTVWKDPQGKISKVVPITKMSVKEMEKILQTFFSEAIEKFQRVPLGKFDNDGLSIITPTQGNSLILMGRREVVDRAEKLVADTENQLQDPAEMTIYIYNCRHSDPNDLAKVLDKVYYSIFHAIPESRDSLDISYTARGAALQAAPDGYAQAPGLTVPPQRFKPEIDSKLEVEQNIEHFIPDVKTGNLLMVVRRDVLPRIKDLLRRLDVPKKMVQIEVLLFEKKLNNQTNYGLNLLKLGNAHNGARYDGPKPPPPNGLDAPVGNGVLAFLFSGNKSKYFPAFDLAYSFLMTQEDIQLNAAPSVITVNQTPATISIMEEISLNNGAAPIDTNKGIAFEKSFTRAQYGINIIMTPIIHMPDECEEDGEEGGFVTLQTNITFDTTKPHYDGRPVVDKRHIENEVRVLDGQTVILGGLRRKSLRDKTQKVPFLGEIPGIGKLFGSTELTDDNTEMFFFITPRIITDPSEELFCLRCQELEKRPGDIPEFLCRLISARECEKKRLFSSSIRAFFGEKQQYYYE
ncbi:MAG: hypothetical protein JSS30_00260 [Verrucomicrobia bacterium]|nr:hypothetical protein [Verrucomicrobiota bacterium]